MTGGGRRVAGVDVGTNTALLLIAGEGADGGLEVWEDTCRTVRLGAELASTGEISAEAAERGLAVLGDYSRRMTQAGVAPGDRRLVGTAVLRRAGNADAFRRQVAERLGLVLEVLEEEEARLGYLAVCSDGAAAETWIVDVGGGSTEVVGDRGASRHSAPIGAVVLTEAFLGLEGRPPGREGGWEGLLGAVEAACACFPRPEGGKRPPEAVLLGGTATNLACLELGLGAFDPAPAEGVSIGAARARHWAEALRALDPEARRGLPIEADRAEILPAGLACIAGVLARAGLDRVRVSGRGLRYGVARELLGS